MKYLWQMITGITVTVAVGLLLVNWNTNRTTIKRLTVNGLTLAARICKDHVITPSASAVNVDMVSVVAIPDSGMILDTTLVKSTLHIMPIDSTETPIWSHMITINCGVHGKLPKVKSVSIKKSGTNNLSIEMTDAGGETITKKVDGSHAVYFWHNKEAMPTDKVLLRKI